MQLIKFTYQMVEEISGSKGEVAVDHSTLIRWLKKLVVQRVKVQMITVHLSDG